MKRVRKTAQLITQTSGNNRWVLNIKKVISIGVTNKSISAQDLWLGIDENESAKFPLSPGDHISFGPDGTDRIWDGQELRAGFAAAAVAPNVNQALVVVTYETDEVCD